MKKIASLQEWLTNIVPGLKDKPENLFIAPEDGVIRPRGNTPTFRMLATVLVVVIDLPSDQVHTLAASILLWAATDQPDLLSDSAAGDKITYRVEPFSRELVDVAFRVPLEEVVSAVATGDGSTEFIQRPEPETDPGWEHLDGWKTTARLARLVVGGDQVLGPSE